MGEVYRARDSRLDRDVAIKVLPDQLARVDSSLARLDREVKAIASLSHPNILSVYDVGTEGEITYAVMELLEGQTLGRLLRSGPLNWPKTQPGIILGTVAYMSPEQVRGEPADARSDVFSFG